VPIALDSAEPQNITVAASPTTTALEGGVRNDLDAVFVLIGVITLLAGGLGIANVTLLGVSERTGEIGLRRALGATRPQIAAQFALESLIVGALGGTIGAAVGVAVVVAVSAASGWTPVLDLALALGSTLLGGLVGLAAGAYPALKAARTEPADALRS
jgi:putative ABC transport system permease protein